MLRLFKRLKPLDWLFLCVLVGFVVLQVYFDIHLATYTRTIFSEMQNPDSTTASILGVGGVMLLFAFGSMASTVIVGFIAAYVSSGLSFRLRAEMFAKVQGFSAAEIDKFSTAGLITRSTNDIQQVQMGVVMILRLAISAPVSAIWAVLEIQSTSVGLTVATAGWIVLMIAAIVALFAVVFPKFRLIQKLTDKLNGVTRENLTGIRVVRAYNAENYQEEKFEKVNDEITATHLFTARVMGFMGPGLMLIFNGIALTIYWLGAHLINSDAAFGTAEAFGIADLTAFVNLSMQVLSAFMMLTILFVMLPRASVSASRINEVLQTPYTVVDKEQTAPITREKGGEIAFENVSFKYPGADGYVLENVNFTIGKGETLAIIGPTGSGKTTLVNLIPRLFDVTDGCVRVGGEDVRNLKQSELHSRVGYVPQKAVLFSGTIADNIKFGGNEDDEKMRIAAEVACADEFIEEKEDGYDSEISQGGKNVSGGQKQRLS
ncbi:MAG: ABC transporter ATP-binding protein, partial [Clostridia bacterium]|nr:ABC transporter ATP-binding protein [Clostridia bacterium]